MTATASSSISAYELPESDIVRTLLKQHKVSADDIRAYIDSNATRREGEPVTTKIQLGASPRVKARSTAPL